MTNHDSGRCTLNLRAGVYWPYLTPNNLILHDASGKTKVPLILIQMMNVAFISLNERKFPSGVTTINPILITYSDWHADTCRLLGLGNDQCRCCIQKTSGNRIFHRVVHEIFCDFRIENSKYEFRDKIFLKFRKK